MQGKGIALALGCLLTICVSSTAAVRLYSGAPQSFERVPLFFREAWKETPELPVTQAFVINSDLELKLYGPGKHELQVVGSNSNQNNLPHIWTGLCFPTCALALRHKSKYVDLSGSAKIRWLTKIAGFHAVRPIVKLADGTWLIGDHTDAYPDWKESEFVPSTLRWRKLDMEKVITIGEATWIEHPDLSKVDEIGFAELMPGSGHSNNGYSDVGWIEVYGNAVTR